MNDEINEILKKLKDDDWYEKLDLTEEKWIELRWEETHLLLDYITNLQQEIETRQYDINNLTYQLAKEKSRIDKAVEYIENSPLYETTYDYNMEEELEIQNVSDETASNKLLNILNGRSDVKKHINKYGDKYKVYLKDKTIIISFIGEQLEEIFKEYNVKYEKVE